MGGESGGRTFVKSEEILSHSASRNAVGSLLQNASSSIAKVFCEVLDAGVIDNTEQRTERK